MGLRRRKMIRAVVGCALLATVGHAHECDASDKVLQLAQVQDVSYSYKEKLTSLIPDIPTVETDLAAMFHGLEIAVTSFSDKGTPPAGDPNGDYCYREDRGFTTDSMVPVLESLETLSGRDWRESQLDAVKYAVLSESLGWERGHYIDGKRVVRVAMVATDALPHVKGFFPAFPDDDPRGCEFSDYPTVEAIGQLLEDNDTYLVVVTIGGIFNSWTNLLKDIPRARVVNRDDSSDKVVDQIEQIICDLPPPPPMRGCGHSSPQYGNSKMTCDEVCGSLVCIDADTARIGTSMEDCNLALDELFTEEKVLDLTLDLFPYAGGCNSFSLFGIRKTILRPDGSGCSAPPGTSSLKDRVCCCAEVGPVAA